MSDPRDYKLEIGGVGPGAHESPRTAARGRSEALGAHRPYLSVLFACCSVYRRVYRDAEGKAYRGRCPRCGVAVTFAVGAGGTSARTFVVR